MTVKNQKFFIFFLIVSAVDLAILNFVLSCFYSNEATLTKFSVYLIFNSIAILSFWMLHRLYLKRIHIFLLSFITILLFPFIIIISQTVVALLIGIENSMPLVNGILSSLIINTIITFDVLYRIWLPLGIINFIFFLVAFHLSVSFPNKDTIQN